MRKATYIEVWKWTLNSWKKIPKDMFGKTSLKAEISDFPQKSVDGVLTNSNISFNDNDSSDLMNFCHLNM